MYHNKGTTIQKLALTFVSKRIPWFRPSSFECESKGISKYNNKLNQEIIAMLLHLQVNYRSNVRHKQSGTCRYTEQHTGRG